jgi:hypothetical protein
LKGAPKVGREENWDDGTRNSDIYGYYGVPPYWI